jgi:hypothetical protein
MAPESTTTVEIPKTRNIPAWLAVLLILLCAGGGGYLAYHFLLGGSDEKIVLLERAPNETIRPWRNNQWTMRTAGAGDADGILIFDPATSRLNFQIFRHDMSHEQNVLLWIEARPNIGGELDITDDQHDQLRKLATAAHVEPPKATMDALRGLFAAWAKAPAGKDKEDMETKLFSMLDDATKAIDAQSKAAQVAKADKVRAILTPDQLKKVPGVKLPWGG